MTEQKRAVSTWPIWVGGGIGGFVGMVDGPIHLALPVGFAIGYLAYLRASTRAESDALRNQVTTLQQHVDMLASAPVQPSARSATAETTSAPAFPPTVTPASVAAPVQVPAEPVPDLDLRPLRTDVSPTAMAAPTPTPPRSVVTASATASEVLSPAERED